MFSPGSKIDKQLASLLVITVLANVPYLAPSVIFVHDTLNNFIFFHYAYSELFIHSEFPRWVPFLGYGLPFDFQMIVCFLPTDYVVMGLGWLFGVQDANLLFKISLILTQAVFVLGLYLLSGKLFQSRAVVWMVCLGALLTNAWPFNALLSFTIFYLLPLVLYLLLRFLETGQASYLWRAATVEALSLLGTMPYIAPIHLLILLAFLLPHFWQRPGLIKQFIRPKNFLQPGFWVFIVLLACIGTIMFRRDAVLLSEIRDRATGNTPMNVFLTDHHEPLAGMLLALMFGHVASGDITLFVGVLPLLMLGLVGRRHDPLFLGFASVAFFLFWLSRAGWFAVAAYYVFPLMNKYHQLSHLFNLIKLFVLLLGGFGLDRLLQMGKDHLGAMPTPPPPTSVGRGWGRRLMLALLVCCAVDALAHLGRGDLVHSTLIFCDTSFSEGWYARWVLLGRFLMYAGLVGWLMRMKTPGRSAPNGPTVPSHAAAVILTVYLLDVGCFWLLTVIQAPYSGPHTIPGQVLRHERALSITQSAWPSGLELTDQMDARPLQYHPQRAYLSNLSRKAEEIFRVITAPRGTNPYALYYSSVYQFMGIDPLMPQMRMDLILPGVKKMIEARGGEVKIAPAITLPENDLAFQRSLGRERPKIRVVHRAVYVENEAKAIQWFQRSAGHDPYESLVITGPPPAVPIEAPSLPCPDAVEVTQFTANRRVIKLWTSAPGWLFSADAYHPAWKASITDAVGHSAATNVVVANVGCKAVYVPAGASEVTFYCADGMRDGIRQLFLFLASVLGFVLTGALTTLAFIEDCAANDLWRHVSNVPNSGTLETCRHIGRAVLNRQPEHAVFPVEPAPPPLTERSLRIWAYVMLATLVLCMALILSR